MAQEFSNDQVQSEEMQKIKEVISMLDKTKVDFVVEGDKILIKAHVVHIDVDAHVPSVSITVFQGGNVIKIYYSVTLGEIFISAGNVLIGLHNHIHIRYEDSYIIIEF